jgi:hypothetical protein
MVIVAVVLLLAGSGCALGDYVSTTMADDDERRLASTTDEDPAPPPTPASSEVTYNVAEIFRNYSTVWNDDAIGTGYARSMLDSAQCWSVETNAIGQWMEMDLGIASTVLGVVSQGRDSSANQRVTTYTVAVSVDGQAWEGLDTIFTGNSDGYTKVVGRFPTPRKARFVRIEPQTWNYHISMRAGVLVCATALATVELQGTSVTTDIFLGSSYPNNRYDTANLEFGADDVLGHKWALIKFDLPDACTFPTAASLEICIHNPGSNGILHEMIVDWDATSHFSSAGMTDTGIGNTGVWNIATVANVTGGGIQPLVLDVTSSVQSWSSGAFPNYGWIFEPTGDDGVEFYSSSGSVPPRLTITYGDQLPPTPAPTSAPPTPAPPSTPIPPPTTPACEDTPGWENAYRVSCSGYADNGFCEDGDFRPGEEWTGGPSYGLPEENCCVCGKGYQTALCEDTAEGAVDNAGWTCMDWFGWSCGYTHKYDDSDFTGLDMCCYCAGGAYPTTTSSATSSTTATTEATGPATSSTTATSEATGPATSSTTITTEATGPATSSTTATTETGASDSNRFPLTGHGQESGKAVAVVIVVTIVLLCVGAACGLLFILNKGMSAAAFQRQENFLRNVGPRPLA